MAIIEAVIKLARLSTVLMCRRQYIILELCSIYIYIYRYRYYNIEYAPKKCLPVLEILELSNELKYFESVAFNRRRIQLYISIATINENT